MCTWHFRVCSLISSMHGIMQLQYTCHGGRQPPLIIGQVHPVSWWVQWITAFCTRISDAAFTTQSTKATMNVWSGPEAYSPQALASQGRRTPWPISISAPLSIDGSMRDIHIGPLAPAAHWRARKCAAFIRPGCSLVLANPQTHAKPVRSPLLGVPRG